MNQTRFVTKHTARLRSVPVLSSGRTEPSTIAIRNPKYLEVNYATELIVEYVPFREDMEPETFDPIASDAAGEDVARLHAAPTRDHLFLDCVWNVCTSETDRRVGAGLITLLITGLVQGGAKVCGWSHPSLSSSYPRDLSSAVSGPDFVKAYLHRTENPKRIQFDTIYDVQHPTGVVLITTGHWTEREFREFCESNLSRAHSVRLIWLVDRMDASATVRDTVTRIHGKSSRLSSSPKKIVLRHLSRLERVAKDILPAAGVAILVDDVETTIMWGHANLGTLWHSIAETEQ